MKQLLRHGRAPELPVCRVPCRIISCRRGRTNAGCPGELPDMLLRITGVSDRTFRPPLQSRPLQAAVPPGAPPIQILLNFGIITLNAKLFEDFYFIPFGLTMPMVIATAIPVYIVFCNILGHIDEKSGFWQIENDLGYRVTPLSDEMLRTIREINKKLG